MFFIVHLCQSFESAVIKVVQLIIYQHPVCQVDQVIAQRQVSNDLHITNGVDRPNEPFVQSLKACKSFGASFGFVTRDSTVTGKV